jgi:hypothetical protein
MSKELELVRIIDAIERLTLRVHDRFPESSLMRICIELKVLGSKAESNIIEIGKPIIKYRLLFYILIIVSLLSIVYTINLVSINELPRTFQTFISTTEALLNEIVMIGAAFYFLGNFENNIKQKRSLKLLHELSVVIHVIDMLQLTKDPTTISNQSTPNSPDRNYNKYELIRYLDYCSEALSLTSKIAACYGINSNNHVVLDSINNIEILCSSISSKIWQKINIQLTIN